MKEEGYTVIEYIDTNTFTAEFRKVCLFLAEKSKGAQKGKLAAMLLGRHSLF